MNTYKKPYPLLIISIALSIMGCKTEPQFTEETKVDYNLVTNVDGAVLAYHPSSNVKILTVDSRAFKDMNKSGTLDSYEDWRLSSDERAKDLASKMSFEQIAGLMLYSSHQSIPARSEGYFAGTYDEKPFEEGVTDPSNLTDQQKKFLESDNLRHVLLTTVKSPEIAAKWNNKIQAYCEGIGLGIPANNSSDPRHGTVAKAEFDAAAGGEISMWPSTLGLAATFNPELVQNFGEIASKEYRALGITTALSPQVDIATDPRWMRFSGTFGESPKLSTAMARAYIDGFQTSGEGWGFNSVNAMVKHWPGGGSGEAGRDAHFGMGKFAVYPGNNFEEHLIPFTEGAFKLKRGTKMASAVMPYYTISWNQDTKNNENVGNAYNEYIIADLLRGKYAYDGVLCTDWGITRDHNVMDNFVDGKPWGVEVLSVAERHYKILKVGMDQFGGNNDIGPVIEAYEMGVAELGEKAMRERMEISAVRLLRNIFNVGLFENPYLDVEATINTVGKPEFMQAGFEAQLKSVVMVKNASDALPLKEKPTVYIPKRFVPASRNFLGMPISESNDYPVNIELAKRYFNVTDKPSEASAALVFIESPSAGNGYSQADIEKGGNGYLPISLQYKSYTAQKARDVSIAGGDPMEDFTNRTYKGKKVIAENITDAEMVTKAKAAMGGNPVIVIVNTSNPMVFSEIEPQASAILAHFGVQDQALFEILSGKVEPKALLPMQMPADMGFVELQAEDVPFDMTPHKDTEGNAYDFAFGLNWKGVINDERTQQYK
ncbi:MAG: glycoside hydrolase family 3 protein [Maribacter sp.]|nr:glycoside hydrolase family 3 protein [Maribacter sp.]